MTNTTLNVPRVLLEELRDAANESMNATTRQHQIDHFAGLIAKADALLSAPSPAGVDGCKGKNCGATDGVSHSDECIAEHEQACGRADLNGLPVAAYLIGGEPSLTPCPVCGVVNEPLCLLSDAQAIIDGLRGDLAVALKVPSVAAMHAYLDTECAKDNMRLGAERDRQAQRIGELEGLLREVRNGLSCENLHHKKSEQHAFDEPCKVLGRIDAALSAGK